MGCEEIICDANNLYSAYQASIKNSKWKDSTQRYMLNYLPNLISLQDQLRTRTLTNSPKKEFILRERGRIRPITSIPVKDRIVRHVVVDKILLPAVKRHAIYDNCASIKGRGLSQQRKRFEVHLHKYYETYHTNDGWILFIDFQKFYDNIIHDVAKDQLLNLVDGDAFFEWILDFIFNDFKIDVSYMTGSEYAHCLDTLFDKVKYRKIPDSLKTGEKYMEKSVNVGDQCSQIIGIYYPHPIDNYVKYVCGQKFYGRYMDDIYIISDSKSELRRILDKIIEIAANLGIHINCKKTHIVKLSKPFIFLQLKYTLTDNGHVLKKILSKKVLAMRKKLKKLAEKIPTGETTYEHVECMFRSWMGSFYKLMTREQRNNMLNLFESLFHKHIIIFKKKLIISSM